MSPTNSPDIVIDFLDELIFSKTGQHLDELKKTILLGTLQGKKYREIADNTHLTLGHITDTGSDLWKILSEVLEIKVGKKNIRTILKESQYNNENNVFGGDFIAMNNVHICNHNLSPPNHKDNTSSKSSQNQLYLDLGDVPEITKFYGRNTELNTLENWIVQEKCRLVTILGLKDIGKTNLSLKLVEKIKDNFNYIIRRSLYFYSSLDELLSDILQSMDAQLTLPQSLEKKLKLFVKFIKDNRCLIILDDLEHIFDCKQLAGIYQEGYQDYQLLFKTIAEINHQSCLLLLSQEQPIDTTFSNQQNKLIKSLILEGLGEDAKEILRYHNLLDKNSWTSLIECYQGHPLWLELVAIFIEEFFLGNVAEFLKIENSIVEETVKQNLSNILQRLTELEKIMLTELASFNDPISVREIMGKTSLSSMDCLKVIQSLIRRIIITKDENTLLYLNPVFKGYLISLSE
ncbi:ATPase [Crocosphaera sp.]|uniref:ATPase n=1 Tax=Crocosphaera sp. TaxID=2729996 RepID=UPI003F25EB6E|nr:ATPase [Crocosphaera sp.]